MKNADATSPSSLSPLSPGVESRPGLLRALGPGMAMAMVVGNVIGSGIFLKPGKIAAEVGGFPMILSAWILGGIVCLLGALCFAELAAMLPRAGGLYVYLREAYGRPVAFLFGWSEFLFGKPASVGALSVAFVLALGEGINNEFSTGSEIALAVILIAAMAWVNVIGVIWGGRLQAATTLIKAGFLGIVALLPLLMMMGGTHGLQAAHYSSTVAPAQLTFATQFAAAMLAVMWAYNGWHGITPVAEEIREPQRNIPWALFGGIGVLIVLYVSANCAFHGVLSMQEMAAADEHAAQHMIRKLLTPWSESTAQIGVAVMSAVVMCSTFGAINSNMLNGPRISFAMGRDDVFFRALGRVHVNYRTPAVSIVVQAVMAALLVVGASAVVEYDARNPKESRYESTPQTRSVRADTQQDETPEEPPSESRSDRMTAGTRVTNTFEMLTKFVVFSASLFYVAAVAAVFVLRRRRPHWERPYRTWGYPIVPAVYLAFYCWFLYYVFVGNPFEARVGLELVGLGIPVYIAYQWWAARHPEILRDGQ